MAYKTFEVDSYTLRYPSPRTVDKILEWLQVEQPKLKELPITTRHKLTRPFAEEIVLDCIIKPEDKASLIEKFDNDEPKDQYLAMNLFTEIVKQYTDRVDHQKQVESESLKS